MKRVTMFSLVVVMLFAASSAFAEKMTFPNVGGITIDVMTGWTAEEASIPADWSTKGITGKEVYLHNEDNTAFMYVFIAPKKDATGATMGLIEICDMYMDLLGGTNRQQYLEGGYQFNFTQTGDLPSTAYLEDSNTLTQMNPLNYCLVRRRGTDNVAVDHVNRMMKSFEFNYQPPSPPILNDKPATSNDKTATTGGGGGGGGCTTGIASLSLFAVIAAFVIRRSK